MINHIARTSLSLNFIKKFNELEKKDQPNPFGKSIWKLADEKTQGLAKNGNLIIGYHVTPDWSVVKQAEKLDAFEQRGLPLYFAPDIKTSMHFGFDQEFIKEKDEAPNCLIVEIAAEKVAIDDTYGTTYVPGGDTAKIMSIYLVSDEYKEHAKNESNKQLFQEVLERVKESWKYAVEMYEKENPMHLKSDPLDLQLDRIS